MSFTVGEIRGVLTLDTSQFQASIRQAASSAASLRAPLEATVSVGTSGFAKLAGAAGLVTAAVMQAVDWIEDMSGRLSGVFQDGIRAVEEYRMSILGIAAGLVSLDATVNASNIGERFQEAKGYAEELYQQILLMDAAFSGTADELLEISRVLVQHGVILDLNNQKVREGLLGFAEAIKTYAGHLNVSKQAAEAVRAILFGMRDEMDQVTRSIGLSGEAGEKLRQTLAGIPDPVDRSAKLMEVLAERTKGFVAASTEVQNTLQAVLSTIRTTVNIVLRSIFGDFYDRLVKALQQVISSLRDAQGHLTPFAQMLINAVRPALDRIASVVERFVGTITKDGESVATFFGVIANLAALLAEGLLTAYEALRNLVNFALRYKPVLEALAGIAGGLAGKAIGGAIGGALAGPFGAAAGGLLGGLSGIFLSVREAKRVAESVSPFPSVAEIAEQSSRAVQSYLGFLRTMLAEDRKAQEERLEAARRVEREILELQGRTHAAKMLQIEEERARIIEKTGDVLLAERYAYAAREKLDQELMQRRVEIYTEGWRAVASATGDSLSAELAKILEHLSKRKEELKKAFDSEAITWSEYAQMVAQAERNAQVEAVKAFASSIEAKRKELSRFVEDYERIVMGLVDIDVRIAHLQAQLRGERQSEVLRSEQMALEAALRHEGLTAEKRAEIARRLQNVIEDRIRALEREDKASYALAAAQEDLNRARAAELQALLKVRSEREQELRHASSMIEVLKKGADVILTSWASLGREIMSNASKVKDYIVRTLASEAPNAFTTAWQSAILAVRRELTALQMEMQKLDPRTRRSPSVVDMVRAGMQEVERIVTRSAVRIAAAIGASTGVATGPGRSGGAGITFIVNGQQIQLTSRQAVDLIELLVRDPTQRLRLIRAVR